MTLHVGDVPHEGITLVIQVQFPFMRHSSIAIDAGMTPEEIQSLAKLASKNNLELIPSKIRLIGTDRCIIVLKKMKDAISKKIEIIFKAEAEQILIENNTYKGVTLKDGRTFVSNFLILAPGREGSKWLEEEARRLKLTQLKNPVDVGVRVELPASVMEHLTKATYEPKLVFYSKKFDDRVRTFCVNPYGEVVKEYLKGI